MFTDPLPLKYGTGLSKAAGYYHFIPSHVFWTHFWGFLNPSWTREFSAAFASFQRGWDLLFLLANQPACWIWAHAVSSCISIQVQCSWRAITFLQSQQEHKTRCTKTSCKWCLPWTNCVPLPVKPNRDSRKTLVTVISSKLWVSSYSSITVYSKQRSFTMSELWALITEGLNWMHRLVHLNFFLQLST